MERRFSCVQGKAFTSYLPSCIRICRRNRIVYKKPNVSRDSSGVLYYCRRPHRKTTNAFSISRASVSPVIKKVSYAITTFSGPKPIKLPATKNKVKELTNKLLGTHEFPQCKEDNRWHPCWDSRTKWTLL